MSDTVFKIEVEPTLQSKALTADLKGLRKDVKDQLDSAFKSINTGLAKTFFDDKSIRQFENTFNKITKKLVEAEKEGDKVRASALQRRLNKELKHQQKLIARRERALAEAERLQSRGVAERVADLTSGVQQAFANIKGGNIGGLLQSLGKGVEAKGLGLASKGAASGSKNIAGLTRQIGNLTATIGPLLVAVGAIAGSFTALVGAVIAVDSFGKQMNQTILQSGITVGDLDSSLQNTTQALGEVRKAAADFTNNARFGTLAEDQIKVLGAFVQSGYTLREMSGNISDASQRMEKLQENTAAALKFAKLLSMSGEEVAQNMGAMMEDLGLTIEGVQDRFGAVYDAAMKSGFGVKRFFNMVLQATSGMALYNVRVEEAAGLLIHLGKILGTKLGGDFLQSLTKGFTDESYQQRYKRVLMTGQKKTAKIMARSASATANDFVDKFARGGELKELGRIMSDMGVNVDLPSSDAVTSGDKETRAKASSELVKGLKQLDPDKQAQMIARVRADNPELARQLENLVGLSQATSGKMGDMVKGLGSLDMGGKLAMQLNSANAIIGAPLHKMNEVQLMAFENMTGISGQQLEELRRVSRGMSGNFQVLQSSREDMQKLAKEDKAAYDQAAKKQVEAYGAYVTESGELMAARIDEQGNIVQSGTEPLKDMDAYVQSQGERLAEAVQEPMSRQEAASEAVVRNTTEMTKHLKMGVEYFLEGIYTMMSDVLGILHKIANPISGLSDEQMQEKSKALDDIKEKRKAAAASEAKIDQNLTTLRGKASMSKGDEKRKLEEDIAALEKKKRGVQAGQEVLGKIEEQVRDTYSSQALGEGTAKDFIKQASDTIMGGKSKSGIFLPGTMNLNKQLTPAEQDAMVAKRNQMRLDPKVDFIEKAQSGEANTSVMAAEELGLNISDGFEGLISSIEKTEEDSDRKVKEREKKLQKEDQKHLEKAGAKAIGKATAKETFDLQAVAKLQDALAKAGVEGDQAILEGMASSLSKGRMTPMLREKLGKKQAYNIGGESVEMSRAEYLMRYGGDLAGKGGLIRSSIPTPKVDDFLLRVDGRGGNVTPIANIDPADSMTMVGSKPGGAISKAGSSSGRGGSRQVVHNHFYNDSRANYNQSKRLFKRMGRGR